MFLGNEKRPVALPTSLIYLLIHTYTATYLATISISSNATTMYSSFASFNLSFYVYGCKSNSFFDNLQIFSCFFWKFVSKTYFLLIKFVFYT